MPKFNEFIKGFEEKETAPQPQEPQVQTPKVETPKGKEQAQPTKQYGGIAGYLQKAGFEPYEVNEEGGYLKVKNNEGKDFEIRNSGKGKYNYNVFEDGKQTYQYVPYHAFFEDIVAGKNSKDLEKYRFKEEPKEEVKPVKAEVQPTPQKQEEPNSQEYEGYRLERTPDGKWVNRDTYEYFDSKVEAQKDIDKFISSQSPNKPKQGKFEQVFGGDNEPRMLYVVYDTPQGKVGDYIELEPDMSEDDIIEQLKENKNVVGVYGGATNVGAIDPKWVRE